MGGGGKGMRVIGARRGAGGRSRPGRARGGRRRGARGRRPRSATARCSLSGTSPTPGTSRSRCSRTATAAWCTASSGSARSSGGTRRSSRSARRRPWIPACGTRMGAAALAAAKAVGYLGAGTVEFVLEPSGDFWFLEVNTRLQVEHPVTEAVTGVDLVREQLLVAQGLPLSVTQDALAIDGHAIEARLYAEDPAAGFLPATGTLMDWCPATAPPCRWDAGVAAGSVVGVEFDPMLAKVIAHAPTRGEAALRPGAGPAAQPDPGRHHQPGLPGRRAAPPGVPGRPHHHVVHRAHRRRRWPGARHAAELRTAAIGAALAAQAAARAAAPVLRHAAQRLAQHRDAAGARRVPARAGHRGGELRRGSVTAGSPSRSPGRPGSGRRTGSGAPEPATWPSLADGHRVPGWRRLDRLRPRTGRRHRLHVLAAGDRVWVQGPDGDVALTAVPRFPESERGEAVAGGLVAPMPGTVLAVHVAPGDTVAAGPAADDRGGHEDGAPDHRTPRRDGRRGPRPARRPGQRRRPAGRPGRSHMTAARSASPTAAASTVTGWPPRGRWSTAAPSTC